MRPSALQPTSPAPLTGRGRPRVRVSPAELHCERRRESKSVMGLGRRGHFFRLSGPAAQHIVGKPRTALGIDRETKFRSPPQDVVGFQRPFFHHYPIDYGGIEPTAEIPPKIRLFVGRIGDRPRSRSVTPRDRAATIHRMPDNRRPTHRQNTRIHPPHRPSATLLLSTGPAYSKSGRGVCYDGFDKLSSRRHLAAQKD